MAFQNCLSSIRWWWWSWLWWWQTKLFHIATTSIEWNVNKERNFAIISKIELFSICSQMGQNPNYKHSHSHINATVHVYVCAHIVFSLPSKWWNKKLEMKMIKNGDNTNRQIENGVHKNLECILTICQLRLCACMHACECIFHHINSSLKLLRMQHKIPAHFFFGKYFSAIIRRSSISISSSRKKCECFTKTKSNRIGK